MLEACLDAGVELKTGTRVQALPDADAVVIATGGFERDPQLASAFLRGPMLAPVGAPSARGDGLRLAIAAGAQLGSMSEAWWCPAASIPGDTIDGEPMFRLILTERARPGCLLVNGRGRRFVDEAQNYNDLGRALQNFEPTSFSFPNVPAWLIFDGTYRATYRLGPLSRRDPDPEWLAKGETLAELAGEIGVPADALDGDASPASTRAPRTASRPRLRPRLLPLRPLHRRPRAARAGAVLRLQGASRAASAPRAARGRTPTAACSRSPTATRSRASTRGQRRGEPVRPRVPRRRRHDRPGRRVRPPSRGRGGRRLTRDKSAPCREAYSSSRSR